MEFNEKLHRRIRWPAVLHILLPLLAAFTALMVVGRLISGVHWLSDIIGSILRAERCAAEPAGLPGIRG